MPFGMKKWKKKKENGEKVKSNGVRYYLTFFYGVYTNKYKMYVLFHFIKKISTRMRLILE